jgi:hypothetical protein
MPPDLPRFADWQDTKTTLHLFAQMVGKVRMALHPKLNHWWHVTLYPSVRGLTTGAIPIPGGAFDLTLDLVDHRLVGCRSDDRVRATDLPGLSVAGFHRALAATLDDLGVDVAPPRRPYDMGDRPDFADDAGQDAYDVDAVSAYHDALLWTAGVFQAYRGRFLGKSTPVHLYWHSFDLAVTRFSGRTAPARGGNPVDAEAYSHEVISCGFWPGDPQTPEAMFYGYTAPEPPGLADAALAPEAASWVDVGGSHMALVSYAALRALPEPEEGLMAFLHAAYEAGADAARWDRAALDG